MDRTAHTAHGTGAGQGQASVSGVFAAGCALLGIGGFLLVPWLAYLPAIAALGLFTLVIWFAAWGATGRGLGSWFRLLVAPALAAMGTAAFWRAGEVPAVWGFAVPFLLTTAALVVERRLSWAVAAAASAVYAVLLWV